MEPPRVLGYDDVLLLSTYFLAAINHAHGTIGVGSYQQINGIGLGWAGTGNDDIACVQIVILNCVIEVSGSCQSRNIVLGAVDKQLLSRNATHQSHVFTHVVSHFSISYTGWEGLPPTVIVSVQGLVVKG